ncbi:MAG: gliding motility-associated C-terminal domain-containing protein [Bacteroidia bacterium]
MIKHLKNLTIGLLFSLSGVYAQSPTVQDCPGAIPICDSVYFENNAYSGIGNILGEINPLISCLQSGEKNDVWYTFTVQIGGILNFSITPNVLTDDYDWAVFNLTTGTCAQISSNPSLQVGCNYAGNPGVTGPNGLPGPQNSPTIPVNAGETYVINVSQFTTSPNGYTINFGASTASIYDNIPPAINSVTSPVACGSDSIVVTFSENVQCSSVQDTDFNITGPLGTVLTVTSAISQACVSGAPYGKIYTLHFTPAISLAGAYNLIVVDTILDLCNNVIQYPASFGFIVNSIILAQVHTNVTCPGGSDGTATANITLGGTPPYTFLWSNGQTTQTATGLAAGSYTVTVTPSGVACPTPITINITAPTAFNVVPNIVGASCGTATGSASVAVTGGTGAYTYLWSNAATNAAAINLFAGTYTVTVTDASFCTYSYSLVVPTTNSITSAIAVAQQVSCIGGNDGNATASGSTGSGSYTYLWSNGITTANAANLSAGTYTVTVTDNTGGCTSTSTVTITQPLTAVSASVTPVATSCNLANGIASVLPNGGTPGYTYLWNNGNTNGALINLSAGTYTITVTDSKGCTFSASAVVAVSTAPALNITASSNVNCFGGSDGSAFVNCTGCTGATTFAWSQGSTTSAANTLSAGTYTATVTDAGNCTSTVSVTITQPTQLIPNSITNDTVCVSNSGTLICLANGGTVPYTYLWSNGQTTAILNTTPAATSNYTITITDAHNCTASQTGTIVLRQPLTLTVSNDTTICFGQSVTLNVSATGGDLNYNFSWNGGLATGNTISITPGQDTTLNVIVTDGCGSPSVTKTIKVTVSQPIVLNITGNTPVSCYNGNNGMATVNVVSGGVAPLTYIWSNGVTAASITNGTATTYTVTVTDQVGCSTTTSTTITQPTAIVLTTSGNVTLCSGRDTTLTISANGGVLPYAFLWNTGATGTTILVSPANSTTYTLTVTDANGCNADTTYLVNVLPPLSISSITPNQDLCKGKSIAISVTATGGNGTYHYSWNNGAVTTPGFTASPLQDTTYTVIVSDGCSVPDKTASVKITVIEAPVVNFSYVPDKGCQPLLVTFTDSSQTVSGSSYFWQFGNGNTSSFVDPKQVYKNFGIFDVTLTVTTPQGCIGKLTKNAIIEVWEKPMAEFSFEPSQPTLYTPNVYFFDKSTGVNSIWYWSFGDGGSASIQNPTHAYKDTGTYKIIFAVTNDQGCTDTTEYDLHIKDEYAFYIPNSFTPNGNGLNDYFSINGINFKSFEVQIYNRHGQLIHHSKNQNNAWDGKDENGQAVQEGVYAYRILVDEPTGKRHTYTGTVSLIR